MNETPHLIVMQCEPEEVLYIDDPAELLGDKYEAAKGFCGGFLNFLENECKLTNEEAGKLMILFGAYSFVRVKGQAPTKGVNAIIIGGNKRVVEGKLEVLNSVQPGEAQ